MAKIKPNMLRKLRGELKLSQREVANRAGITDSYLSRLETVPEEENASDEVVLMLANVFNVPVSQLYDLTLEDVDSEVLRQAMRKADIKDIIAIKYSVDPDVAAWVAQAADNHIRGLILLRQREQRRGGKRLVR